MAKPHMFGQPHLQEQWQSNFRANNGVLDAAGLPLVRPNQFSTVPVTTENATPTCHPTHSQGTLRDGAPCAAGKLA